MVHTRTISDCTLADFDIRWSFRPHRQDQSAQDLAPSIAFVWAHKQVLDAHALCNPYVRLCITYGLRTRPVNGPCTSLGTVPSFPASGLSQTDLNTYHGTALSVSCSCIYLCMALVIDLRFWPLQDLRRRAHNRPDPLLADPQSTNTFRTRAPPCA